MHFVEYSRHDWMTHHRSSLRPLRWDTSFGHGLRSLPPGIKPREACCALRSGFLFKHGLAQWLVTGMLGTMNDTPTEPSPQAVLDDLIAAAEAELTLDQSSEIMQGIQLARERLLRLEAIVLSHRILAEERAAHV